jgi:sugar lactone lactonase YvrE
MTPTLILDARNIVGESALWDAGRGLLRWVDLVGRNVHSMRPDDPDSHRVQPVGDLATSLGLTRDGRAILGGSRDVRLWDFADGFEHLATPEPDLPGNRLNEGVVAPDGSFWVGTMQNNVAPDGSPVDIANDAGRLYRIAPDGVVTRLTEDRFGITNTLAWTPDGRLLTADTMANTLYSYPIENSRLGPRRTLLENFPRGLPDGSALDAEGALWNCRVVGGACVIRILPDGTVDRIIDLPCTWPTSCAFGGEDLRTLFITSARFTMSPEHLAANPSEGALFAVNPGVGGLQPNLFGA